MPEQITQKTDCFTPFDNPIDSIPIPERFTYPFYYEPHPLCLLAVEQLQKHLTNQQDWTHDFGIDHFVEGVNIGKMFGVLVVKNHADEIGFLSAFSGKLADQNLLPGFVPPVADILIVDGFFRRGEKEIQNINAEIIALLESEEFKAAKDHLESLKAQSEEELIAQKTQNKTAKALRKKRRAEAAHLPKETFDKLEENLQNESKREHFELKDLAKRWRNSLTQATADLEALQSRIDQLKQQRKARSGALQKEIFDQYQFLNIAGETKSVLDIFRNTSLKTPPSGAGDCALPKLLQYAFQHKLKPIAMAEFWWGQSPSSEIRKHGYFYPSCKGKCEPILAHMMAGMTVDPSPISQVSTEEKVLETIFEDEALLVINKPADFLSVPGKTNADSVYQRMLDEHPEFTGPLMVHRLDRATSGLMLIPKTKDAHQNLQEQFRLKTVKKQYIALLEGIVSENEGSIDLPIRVDLEDRPRQLVCHEHGKPALTYWKVMERKNNRTLVHFFPQTGRTHQLRVHAAHPQGLNIPIVGDDLYGKKDSRLHLHAESIKFDHPDTGKPMTFSVKADFG